MLLGMQALEYLLLSVVVVVIGRLTSVVLLMLLMAVVVMIVKLTGLLRKFERSNSVMFTAVRND